MSTTRRMFGESLQWVHHKKDNRNFLSATFHMITISIISMTLVQLNWFTINGGDCIQYLTLSDFFTFGYSNDATANEGYECISKTTVNLMRIIILLCFMAIIFSLVGFFLEITGPKTNVSNIIRKYSLASASTVIWITIIISVCYCIVNLIQESLVKLYPKEETSVSYACGFYLIVGAGGLALVGTFISVLLSHSSTDSTYDPDDVYLIDSDVDILDSFHAQPPPPPYNVPPPPYTP